MAGNHPIVSLIFSVTCIFLSANPFDMDQSKNLSFGKVLRSINSHSHTMTHFDVSGKETLWEKEKMLVNTMFSTLSKTEIIVYITIILSSANAFNLDKVKFLSSGYGLKCVS